MDNFEKILSQKLQQEQEFDFRESDWQEVAGQLDATVAPAPINWKAWAVAAILLLMLGTIGWLSFELNDANNTIDTLENQSVAENFRVDTIYQEVPVIRIDTILQTTTITAPITKAIYFPAFSQNQFLTTNPRFNTHDISVTGTEMLGTSVFSPFFNLANRGWKRDDDRSKKEISADEDIFELELSAPNSLASLNLEELTPAIKALTINNISPSELTLSQRPDLRDYLRPIGAKIGVSAGKSFLTASDLTHVASSNFGLKGEVNFVRNASFTAGIDWFKIGYQTTNFENLGREIPVPDTDILGERNLSDLVFTSVSQRFTQYKFGLKYHFRTKNEVTPYLGINYLASSNFKKDFYYFFEVEPNSGINVDVELSNGQSKFSSDGFGLDLGVELMSNNWLSFQIEGYYHFINPEMRSQYHDLVGIRLAVLAGWRK